MRRFGRLLVLGFLLIALAVSVHPMSVQTVPPSGNQEHPRRWLNPDQESAIDQSFLGLQTRRDMRLLSSKTANLSSPKGYGLANLDDDIPITPETSFHLASLSKQFTGAAIALLILDGKIALSDPVAKYLPEVAKYGNGLRIEHLVYMTSGAARVYR